MVFPPQFAGHRLGSASALHSLEFYLDYVCPFSKKMFKTIHESVWPWIEKEYPDKVQLIFRQQVQPWHATSTTVHESAIAFEKICSEKFPDKHSQKFFEFSAKLFDSQNEFFDEAVEELSRRDIVKKLTALAATLDVSTDEMNKMLFNGTGEPKNAGNKVTNDLKLQVKFGRQNGIHVSPTITWDGIRDDSVSSSWTLDQWKEYLEKKI